MVEGLHEKQWRSELGREIQEMKPGLQAERNCRMPA
jgi:hypothetical protein